MRVRFGLRERLLLWTLTAVNLAFVVVWLVSTRTAREGMVTLADANLGLGAQNLADAVSQMLSDTYADGLTTSRLDLCAQAIETKDPKNIAWYSDEMVQQKGRYAAILVADKDGKIVAANTVSRDGKKIANPMLGRSLGDAPWVKAALAAERGKGIWISVSQPGFLDGSVTEPDGVVGYSFPVFDILDERIGTLTVFLSLSALGKQLDGYVVGGVDPESLAMVVDAQGVPVALPSNLPNRTGWRSLRVADAASEDTRIADPAGSEYFVVQRPIAGAAKEAQWRVAAMKTAKALEAPVDRISDRLLIAFAIAVLATTALLVLSANRLIGPIRNLTEATRAVGKASEYKEQPVRTSDEVGVLTASFNDLFQSLREHEEGLEQKVTERTREVEGARRDLADILDNMRQAIFTVGQGGRIGGEHSAFTKTLFEGVTIAGADVMSFLQLDQQADRQAGVRMRFWLENIFGANELQWILASQDAPRELVYHPVDGGAPKYLELDYAPVFKDDVVFRIMVIAKDVTEIRSLESAMSEKERLHQRSLARIAQVAAMDADLFATFLSESRTLLSRCDAGMKNLEQSSGDKAAIDEIFRAVHTLKSNARIFHVGTMQELAHEVEEEFQALREGGEKLTPEALENARSRVGTLHAELEEIERLEQLLFGKKAGPKSGRALQVAESRVLELRRRSMELAKVVPADVAKEEIAALKDVVQSLTHVRFGELFDRMKREVADLARAQGKQVAELKVVGDDVAVDEKLAQKLRDAFGHALRNAVVHGIETPQLRRAAGKPEKGSVEVEAKWHATQLVVSLSDDGRGFDADAIKRRALERRLIPPEKAAGLSEQETLDLAFLPGVSTSDKVTDVSGRGVGMDVVRTVMATVKGTATLKSRKGKGSTLILTVPRDYERFL